MTYGAYFNDSLYAEPASGDIMEHLQRLRWYGETKLASVRLHMIAARLEDTEWITEKEEEWINERQYWNGHYGYFGKEWE